MTVFFLPAFILEPEADIQIEDSLGNVFNQTLTYSGDEFDEKSLKLNVPPHRGEAVSFDRLTVVMHAATFGYWHHPSLKVSLSQRIYRVLIELS